MQPRAARRRRDVFAFGTHLTDLTPAFRWPTPTRCWPAASTRIDDFAGGTRLGESLAACASTMLAACWARRTLVLLITDGLDTGEPAAAGAPSWSGCAATAAACCGSTRCCASTAMRRWRAARAAVLHQHAHAMLAVHNLSKLEDLARPGATGPALNLKPFTEGDPNVDMQGSRILAITQQQAWAVGLDVHE